MLPRIAMLMYCMFVLVMHLNVMVMYTDMIMLVMIITKVRYGYDYYRSKIMIMIITKVRYGYDYYRSKI